MIRWFDRVGIVIVLGVLVGACGGANPSGETAVPVDDRPAVVTSLPETAPADALEGSGPVPAGPVPVDDRPAVVVSLPEAAPADADPGVVPVVSDGLLSVVISPCMPLGGVDDDPCSPQLPPSIHPDGLTASIPSFVKNPPSFDDIMSGMGIYTPHIVVRVTVEPGTTRCEAYLTRHFPHLGGLIADVRNYWCFADVRVNEYIVGAGPTALTIGFLRNTFLEPDGRDWERDKEYAIEYEFGNPAERTATTYEGRELVLFLKSTDTMTVEAWVVGGHWDTWFVRRDPDADPPTVTAAFQWEDRVVSEVDLDDLITGVKAAAAARTATDQTTTTRSTTESRDQTTSTTAAPTTTTGFDADGPPYLVARADQLRDFYIAGGAVYEGDDATTVLPPPAPIPPDVPTNVEMSVGDDGQILITWDAPIRGGQVEEYRLWLAPVVADETTNVFPNVPSWRGERFFDITWVVEYLGAEFTVQIRAGNDHGFSPWTDKQTFTTPG